MLTYLIPSHRARPVLGFAVLGREGDHLCPLQPLPTWWSLSSLRGCYSISKPRLTLGQLWLCRSFWACSSGQATAFPAMGTLQFLYGSGNAAVKETLTWTNVVASGYISLLKMVIMPLVLVMMIAAVVRIREVADLGRIGGSVVGILVSTTAVAALVGIFVSNFFGLSADAITQGARELERAASLTSRYENVANLGLADMLVSFIPSNIFSDLTGARPTSIIAVVIFGILFGLAALGVTKEDPARGEKLREAVLTMQAVIMRLVQMIMAMTPYGILALMTRVVAGSNAQDLWNLVEFVGASYVAIIAIMFAIHGILLQARRRQRAFLFQNGLARAGLCLHVPELCRHHSPERGDTG